MNIYHKKLAMKKISYLFCLLLTFGSFNAIGSSYYWVGGSGSWNNYSSHWATSSGGTTFYTSAPSSTDDVFFDANSFSSNGQNVTLPGTTVSVHNFDWTGVTVTASVKGGTNLYVSGAFILVPGITCKEPALTLNASSGTQTFDPQGDTLGNVFFNGAGAWNLSSELHCNYLTLTRGTVNTQNYDVYISHTFSIPSNGYVPTFNPGSSDIYMLHGSFYNTNLKLSSKLATFHLYELNSTSNFTIGGINYEGNGGNYPYIHLIGTDTVYHVRIHEMPGTFIADNACFVAVVDVDTDAFVGGYAHYGRINAYRNLEASPINVDTLYLDNYFHTVSFYPGAPHPVIGALLTGTAPCNGFITMNSDSPGISAELNVTSSASLDQFVITDIEFTSANITATNSVDLGNVINCSFSLYAPTPDTLYWVNGGGYWSDINHWSSTSGGSPASCRPAPSSTIIFDSNSFSSADTVYMDIISPVCENFIVKDVPDSTRLFSLTTTTTALYPRLYLRGSMELDSGLIWNYVGIVCPSDTGTGRILRAPTQTFFDRNDYYRLKFFCPGSQWQYVGLSGNTMITNSITIDTLRLENPYDTLRINADSTVTVSNELSVSSGSGHFISLGSTSSGVQANLTVNTGSDLCFDYLKIKDINAGGSSTFYAGANSVDLGNNSGITFSDCPGPRLSSTAQPAALVTLFPNPANDNSTLSFEIMEKSYVTVELYDFTGRCIYRSEAGERNAGKYEISLPVKTLAAGMYSCRFTSNGETQAILLVKAE